MSEKSLNIIAREITSEKQLDELLKDCGIPPQSSKDGEWISYRWKKEFEPNSPPLACQIEVVGAEDFTPVLYVAIEKDKFVIYMFNEQDHWFDRLGDMEGFSSVDELKEYLTRLVNQYLINWKKWMKKHHPGNPQYE